MAEDNLKNFTVATVFIFICSVSLLYFALGYPALNNQDSVLLEDSRFNTNFDLPRLTIIGINE